jgi:hypothetical protein
VSMLSPGGVGRSRPYIPPHRRRRARRMRLVAALTVVAVAAGAGWYVFLREPAPKARAKTAACPTARATPGGAARATTAPGTVAQPVAGQPPVAARQVAVNVYNATTRKGLAAQTAAELRKRGFVIGKIANDPLNKAIPGTAEVRGGRKSRNRVTLVSAYVAGARPVIDQRPDLTVDLVVGQRFAALRTPAQVTTLLTPPKPPGC